MTKSNIRNQNELDDELWGEIPPDLDEAQAYHDGLMMQSDPKELAKRIDSVVSEKAILKTLESQEPSNEAEQPTDLELQVLNNHPELTLQQVRDNLDGLC